MTDGVKKTTTFNDLWKMALREAERLRMCSKTDSINSEKFDSIDFYSNIEYYSSVPLYELTNLKYVSSDKSINKAKLKDIYIISETRDHSKNIYTPLEYFLINDIGRDKLLNILKPNF